MNRCYYICQSLLACLLLLSALPLQAQFTIAPRNVKEYVNTSVEKGYGEVLPIFDKIKACQASPDQSDEIKKRCENIVLLCRGHNFTTYGSCANAPVENNSLWGSPTYPAITEITLQFIEQRSKASRDIKLYGYRNQGGGYTPTQNWSNTLHNGYSSFFVGMGIAEMNQFPFGGVWKGTLRMHLYSINDRKLFEWNADITINVTDSKNMQIYLPQLTGNTPTVDLNLQARSGIGANAIVSGNAHIDTCLYDGFNSNSTRFTLTASNPDGNAFLVKNQITDPKAPNRNKISYQVLVTNPGSSGAGTLPLQPGQAKEFAVPDTTPVKLVQLPNIAGSVMCVPWGIDLKTEMFKQSEKLAGTYNGKLNITFSPSTNQLP